MIDTEITYYFLQQAHESRQKTYEKEEISRMTFAKISEVLDTKTYVIGDSEFAKSRSGHSFDGIHLKPYFAEHYYRVILTKFSDQCLISIHQ